MMAERLDALARRAGACWSGGITARTEADMLCLRFRVRHRGDAEWKAIEQRVPIIWTACHFGGHRPWFRCNNCSGRAAVLYSAGEVFACRRCCGLAYESQQEPLSQRGLLKAQKIRERLGGDPDVLEAFPDRPKGMHSRTYERPLSPQKPAHLPPDGKILLRATSGLMQCSVRGPRREP
jgi:hypothetical protein